MPKKRPGVASAGLALGSVDPALRSIDNRYGESLAIVFGDHDQSGRSEKSHSDLVDYQMKLMLREQQNKKTLLEARLAQYNMSTLHPQSSFESGKRSRDWQKELLLSEQHNKKMLLLARQEQDNMSVSHPGSGSGFSPSMSPTGSRAGPSPNPAEQIKKGASRTGQPGSLIVDGAIQQQRAEPAIYMRYTISEDMSQCTEAQEKTRLRAVHDRRSPFVSKRCRLLPNSADRARKNPEAFLNQAPTEFNEKLEQQRTNRMYYPDVHANT